MAEYSLSDIAAATGNGNCNGNSSDFGGNGAWWIIILFIFAFCGWGGFGNGNWGGAGNGGGSAVQGALTRGDLCMDMNFSQLENGVRGVADGISSLGYDQLSQFNALNSNVASGFAGVNNAICTLGYNQAQLANQANITALQGQNAIQSQIAQCCCDNREAIAGLKYDMATSDCSIKTLINQLAQQLMWGQQSGIRDLTDLINNKFCQLEINQKDAVIADLRTKLAACGDQTTAQYIINQITGLVSPRAVPAYPAASPCGLGNWSPAVLANSYGHNGGCGCNTGCGCGPYGA